MQLFRSTFMLFTSVLKSWSGILEMTTRNNRVYSNIHCRSFLSMVNGESCEGDGRKVEGKKCKEGEETGKRKHTHRHI